MNFEATFRATMHPLRKRFLNDLTAASAPLAGALGVDKDHFPTSSPSHVGKNDLQKPTLRGVQRLFAQTAPGETLSVQIFNAKEIKPSAQLPGQFPVEIFSLSLEVKEKTGDPSTEPLPAFRTFFLFAQDPLSLGDSLFGLLIPAGIGDEDARREGEEVLNPDIDSNGLSRLGKWFLQGVWVHFDEKGGIPAVRFSGEINPLDLPLRERAVKTDPNHADVLDAERFPEELDAVSVGELKGPKVVGFFEARVTGLLPGLDRPEKSLKRLVEAAQDLLTGGEVQKGKLGVFLAFFFELERLVKIADGFLFFLPGLFPFSQSVVVKTTGGRKELLQGLLLGTRGFQAELISPHVQRSPWASS